MYRTITKRSHIGVDEKPAAIAFFRRPPKEDGTIRDEDGVSVNYNVELPDGCPLSGKKLIASLHVGHIRSIDSGLDVIPDSTDHANITGLPRPEDDHELAEQLAAQLATQSRIA